MKRIKKIVLALSMSLVLSASAFAASGFEFIASVPIGMQINMAQGFSYEADAKAGNGHASSSFYSDNLVGFNTGIDIKLGYMFQVKENFGISLLADFGYRFDNYGGTFKANSGTNQGAADLPPEGAETKFGVSTHTFKIGIMPKFNINAFSIGIGGGILIPMGASHKYDGVKSPYDTKIDTDAFPMGFYTELTFDYSIFLTETSAINIGLYAGYSVSGLTLEKSPVTHNDYENYRVGSGIGGFDIGAQIGYRFGPKAF